MIKLYKKENSRLLYHEAWVNDDATGIIHYGRVGHKGKQEQHSSVHDEAAFLASVEQDARGRGYAHIADTDKSWLVVQYPLKSKFGSNRDRWLKDKVYESLNEHLGWHGLGHADGHDIGNHKLNIFCVVVDANRAVAAAKSCLRTSRLDFNRARIATRAYDSDEDYVLQYSRNPIAHFSAF